MSRLRQLADKVRRHLMDCPIVAPWSYRGAGRVMREVHRLRSRYAFHRQSRSVRVAAKLAFGGVWPLALLYYALRYTRGFGRSVQQRAGTGVAKQFIDQLTFGLRDATPSHSYYLYRWYRPEHRREAGQYLASSEVSTVFSALNGFTRSEPADDKWCFSELMREHGLPVALVHARVVDGEWMAEGAGELPGEDLFVKPVRGARGDGAMRWDWAGDGRYRNRDGVLLDRSGLRKHVLQASRKTQLLVQPRLRNHVALEHLSRGGLVVARIVTGKLSSGEVDYIIGVLTLPLGDDFVHARGIVSPIDRDSGVLGGAVDVCIGGRRYQEHPDTGARISGVPLPFWTEAVAVTRQAHVHFDRAVFLGWDLALTDAGPVLLETNVYWDPAPIQLAHGMGLGRTRFAAVCSQYV